MDTVVRIFRYLLSIIFIWVLFRIFEAFSYSLFPNVKRNWDILLGFFYCGVIFFGGIIIGNWIVSTIEKETRRKMRE